jgi:phytanoyl-CoA hydroxylase
MKNTGINTERVRHEFEQNGFAIIRNVFSKERCKQMIDEIEDVLNNPPATTPDDWIVYVHELSEWQREMVTTTESQNVPYIIGNIPDYFPLCLDALCNDVVNNVIRECLDTDILHYHFSNLTIKAEYVGPRISWHRDFPNRYLCPMNSTFVRALICLDNMDTTNGATGFNTTSHLIDDATLLNQMNEGYKEHYTPTEHDVYAECSAGDVVLIHSKVIHGGSSNRSPNPRRLLVAQWGKPTTDWLYYTPEKGTGLTAEELRRRNY